MSEYRPEPRGAYRIYVLIILTVTYIFSYIDRQILTILIEDVGTEFGLNDAQRGLLIGLAFALFYAGLGVPVAYLADRTNRKNIVSIALTIWSAATALCATTTGFWSLFAARVAVGVGEAGGSPPSHSIISDYFQRSELTRALSVYTLGTTLGAFFGLTLGGFLGDNFGWRWTFVIVGIPGLLLAALVYFTVKEPKRGNFVEGFDPDAPKAPFFSAIGNLTKNSPYMGALVAHTLAVIVGYVVISWLPSIMVRNFELSKSAVGLYFGIAVLVGGLPGMLAGGFVTDHLAKRDIRWMAWVPAIAMVFTLPLYAGALFGTDPLIMSIILAGGVFFFNLGFAPGLSIVQAVVRPDQRAMASAFVFFFANLFGLGMGPTISGAMSDILKPEYGELSLNYSVALICLILIPAALVFFWTAAKLKGHELPATAH